MLSKDTLYLFTFLKPSGKRVPSAAALLLIDLELSFFMNLIDKRKSPFFVNFSKDFFVFLRG